MHYKGVCVTHNNFSEHLSTSFSHFFLFCFLGWVIQQMQARITSCFVVLEVLVRMNFDI